ncbi:MULTISPECIES: flagellar biosynthesis protein FlhF [Paenibacillus]|uniref:flagellar biosynthesis protein FlhF n=1 Tax=Paenibacillus TaxID=44249 RepID=UPI0022B8D69E|nr:flagellar biosynthesis protein FlhF [Paenibacillus caseinilyticus]MCZ8520037.1 flagellar biosynthesis protein FlhF [Paenibacillus caseinilyticus]
MRVKRYVVDSMPDALQKIRTDLGKDAVIINTKEIRSGGFLGMFTKKKIEVIAATDTASPSGTPSAAASSVATMPKPAAPVATAPRSSVASAYGAPSAPPQAERHEAPLAFPDVPDVFPSAPAPAPRAVQPASQAPQAPLSRPETPGEDVLGELRQMKEMMRKLSSHQALQVPTDPAVEAVEQRLLEQEVDPLLVKQLVSQVMEDAEEEPKPLTEDFVLTSIRRQLMNFMQSKGTKSIKRDTRIAHFVGPTGVGKTTTIAKLAAEQVLKHGRKVGFITSDTYRIAAVEQLKTYATILNVPLEVVFSPLDLGKAFENLKDRDLIFMDTAGRNFRNEMYVSELNALLKSGGQSETFLVLSLTTKYKDMKVITSNFSKFKLDKVLFTKMDETDSFGAIINLIRDFGLQTSYIANGQNVPDDIEELDEMRMIDLILEDNNHE